MYIYVYKKGLRKYYTMEGTVMNEGMRDEEGKNIMKMNESLMKIRFLTPEANNEHRSTIHYNQ